jgi:hypothetical protein
VGPISLNNQVAHLNIISRPTPQFLDGDPALECQQLRIAGHQDGVQARRLAGGRRR